MVLDFLSWCGCLRAIFPPLCNALWWLRSPRSWCDQPGVTLAKSSQRQYCLWRPPNPWGIYFSYPTFLTLESVLNKLQTGPQLRWEVSHKTFSVWLLWRAHFRVCVLHPLGLCHSSVKPTLDNPQLTSLPLPHPTFQMESFSWTLCSLISSVCPVEWKYPFYTYVI